MESYLLEQLVKNAIFTFIAAKIANITSLGDRTIVWFPEQNS